MDLAEMLGEEGYDVVGQAGDGARAVELAEELRPDLVILDVKMPVLDGIAAAERIAGQRIAPVVILTAFSQRELVERARDAGAMAYLVKPFTKSDLVPAIEMAVSRFAELDAARARGRRPQRAAGDPQGGRPGQGRPAEGARHLASPTRSGGSRRPRWTCGSRCARSPTASSSTVRAEQPDDSSETMPGGVGWNTLRSPRLPVAPSGVRRGRIRVKPRPTIRERLAAYPAAGLLLALLAPLVLVLVSAPAQAAEPTQLCVPSDTAACIVGTLRSEEDTVADVDIIITAPSGEETTVTTDDSGKWSYQAHRGRRRTKWPSTRSRCPRTSPPAAGPRRPSTSRSART